MRVILCITLHHNLWSGFMADQCLLTTVDFLSRGRSSDRSLVSYKWHFAETRNCRNSGVR